LWPGQDPIGRRIHIVELQSKDPWQTVVGLVGRVKQESLESNPRIAFYLPHAQFPARAMTIALRGSTDLSATVTAVKNVLRNLDPDLPMYYVRTMAQRVDESLSRRRFSMLLLGVFASIALVLATIENSGWIVITTAWGMAVVGGICTAVACGSPAAHINPAVTLASAFLSGNWATVLPFWAAQFLGAF